MTVFFIGMFLVCNNISNSSMHNSGRQKHGLIDQSTQSMPLGRDFHDTIVELREMREDLNWRRRIAKEQLYRMRAAAIFRSLLVEGYDATNQVPDFLLEACRTEMISNRDYQEALAADLLWGG